MESLYIHIPFCNRICTYCDFNKVLIKNQPVDEYIEALLKELSQIEQRTFKTIFVGGGTPTALTEKQLRRLLEFINKQFIVTNEFSFEANPDELTPEKLTLLHQHGVNRISLGVQTFNDDLLNVLGRTHQTSDIYNSINHLDKIGLNNYSIDLMYNLPGETMDDIENSLTQVQQIAPKHVSWYSLIIEPHTVFYNKIRQGKMTVGDNNAEEEKYQRVINGLEQLGYPQYEISNFADSPYQSEHNKTYWKNDHYYGAGAGSHGYLGNRRYYNIKPVNHYINAMTKSSNVVKEVIELTKENQMEEEMFLGLRMNQGVNKGRFQQKFDLTFKEVYGDVAAHLEEKGYISQDEHSICLTPSGRIVGNDVFSDFLL
jgi:putative oxygen-independent coproporphyrinogen III oxidase